MEIEPSKLDTRNALRITKQLIKITTDERITVSTRKLKWASPFGMLLTAYAIKQARVKNSGNEFIIDYVDSECTSYAGHMGFFKSISPKIDKGKNPGEALGNDNYIPITHIDFAELIKIEKQQGRLLVMGDVVNKEASKLAKILSRGNSELNELLQFLLCEMLRNIPEHAGVKKAAICGQYWQGNQMAEIAVIDEGIGIKQSLQSNLIHKRTIETTEEALQYAIKAGISESFQPSRKNNSQDIWANSGFGLYMISKICQALDGEFLLLTGDKYIKINKNGTQKIGDTSFQGTSIKIRISTENLIDTKRMLYEISKEGEEQAKTIRNAFSKASQPSKGMLLDM